MRLAPVRFAGPRANGWTSENERQNQRKEKYDGNHSEDAEGNCGSVLANPDTEEERRDERKNISHNVQYQRRFHSLVRVTFDNVGLDDSSHNFDTKDDCLTVSQPDWEAEQQVMRHLG